MYGIDNDARGEHYTSARQKAGWAQQAQNQQAMQAANYQANREMFERGMLMEEQGRRNYDSRTAREMGQKKYGVLDGLLGGGFGMQTTRR